MKALIFNSGLGSRLGDLTASRPKCMVALPNSESIFHRQLRILSACGIREFVVTTGPYPKQLHEVAREFERQGCQFTFIGNPIYRETNYIYSLWLAREALRDDDVLMLHGDLVFDAAYVQELLDAPDGSWGSANPSLPIPEKDFSADVANGELRAVGVGIEGDGLTAFQAMYRLTPRAMDIWLIAVDNFVSGGVTGVYAENAANTVFADMHVRAFSYEGHVLEEIDTPEDLRRVGGLIRSADFTDQPVFELNHGTVSLVEGSVAGTISTAEGVRDMMASMGMSRPLVVVDAFFSERLATVLGGALLGHPSFSGYAPNPTYEQVRNGVELYRARGCDGLVSLGGGSAIDVAKCIKLWANLERDGRERRFCDMSAGFSGIPHLSIPTTAGTGSESTHFAVVYVDGIKRSISKDCMQPDAAVLAPELLAGLPDYQRKSTMLDALCQAIESYWSVASSEESRAYSARAIAMAMGCWEAYLDGDTSAARQMHHASNLAGKAINLTTTTLAHAMSYKLTSLYGIAHGHAVALCMPFAWKTLLERGDERTMSLLRAVDALMAGGEDALLGSGLSTFECLLNRLDLSAPEALTYEDLDWLANSVNSERMGNYPVKLTTEELREAYRTIVT